MAKKQEKPKMSFSQVAFAILALLMIITMILSSIRIG
jgi:hypothetical protein